MSILSYNFDAMHEKVINAEPDFSKILLEADEVEFHSFENPEDLPRHFRLSSEPELLLYPSEYVAMWADAEKRGDDDAKKYTLIADKFDNPDNHPDILWDSTKHTEFTYMYPSSKEEYDARGERPRQVYAPFNPERIPGLEPCTGGKCNVFFWTNFFLSWPLPARQLRTLTAALNGVDGLLPGYVKGTHHNDKYDKGVFGWSTARTKYYPIGRNVPDWNAGLDSPAVDWSHYLNSGPATDADVENWDQAVAKGIPEVALRNAGSFFAPENPPLERAEWQNIYNHRIISGDGGSGDPGAIWKVANKFALYVFLHYMNSAKEILSEDDFRRVARALQMGMTGEDTKPYQEAGKVAKKDYDAAVANIGSEWHSVDDPTGMETGPGGTVIDPNLQLPSTEED